MTDAIRITRHARNRMRQWRLVEEVVVDVLAHAEHITEGLYGRMHAWRRTLEGWIRVTYVREGEGCAIITVTVRRRGPEE